MGGNNDHASAVAACQGACVVDHKAAYLANGEQHVHPSPLCLFFKNAVASARFQKCGQQNAEEKRAKKRQRHKKKERGKKNGTSRLQERKKEREQANEKRHKAKMAKRVPCAIQVGIDRVLHDQPAGVSQGVRLRGKRTVLQCFPQDLIRICFFGNGLHRQVALPSFCLDFSPFGG